MRNESTAVRNPTNVSNVGKPFGLLIRLKSMNASTPGTDPMNVRSVGKALQLLINFTPVTNLIYVSNVGKNFCFHIVCKDIY